MVQNRDRHLCLRGARTEEIQSSCELGDKVTLEKLSHLAEGHPRRGRRWKSCEVDSGRSHDSCTPSAPKVRVRRWERRKGKGKTMARSGREDEAEKQKTGSSVAATQARGQEKNKVDVRTRYKGLCGCLRETEGGALCFPRSEEIGPSSTLESRFLLYLHQRVHGSRPALGNALLAVFVLAIFNVDESTFHR